MKISQKKITLTFYAYSSIILLVIFTITCICERFLPTLYFVKSLITICTVTFLITGLIYLVNECRKKPVIILLILAGILGLFILYFTGNYHIRNENYTLSKIYIKNLNSYTNYNTMYKKGYALYNKIDDLHLLNSSMWQAMLKYSINQKDFIMFLNFYKQWWVILTPETIKTDTVNFSETKKDKVQKYKPGDIIFEDGFCKSFYKQLSNHEIWITCTPDQNTHKEYKQNTVGKYDVYSWNILLEN